MRTGRFPSEIRKLGQGEQALLMGAVVVDLENERKRRTALRNSDMRATIGGRGR